MPKTNDSSKNKKNQENKNNAKSKSLNDKHDKNDKDLQIILNDVNLLASQLLNDVQDLRFKECLPIISPEQSHLIQKYCQLLIKWNDVYNLSALKSINDIYILHVLDCLVPLQSMQNIINKFLDSSNSSNYSGTSGTSDLKPKCVLDVGSGAGLPGLLWAIVAQNITQNLNYQIITVDAVQKKIAFQQQACLELNLTNAAPCHQRIEDVVGGFDFITARAYSSFDKLLSDTAHLRNTSDIANGYFLLKGQLNDEVLAAKTKYPALVIQRLEIPYLNAERHLLYLPFAAIE